MRFTKVPEEILANVNHDWISISNHLCICEEQSRLTIFEIFHSDPKRLEKKTDKITLSWGWIFQKSIQLRL